MSISLSPFAPESLVLRDGFGSPVPRQPAHRHTQAESGAYLRDSSRVSRGYPFIIGTHYVLQHECSSTYTIISACSVSWTNEYSRIK